MDAHSPRDNICDFDIAKLFLLCWKLSIMVMENIDIDKIMNWYSKQNI